MSSRTGAPSTVIKPAHGSTRNFGLDVMRATAIFFVVVSHYGGFVWVHTQFPHADLIFILGVLGVDTFFVLSGFLIGNMLLNIMRRGVTWCRWKVFIQRRAWRVMPVYYLWLLTLLVIAATPQIDLARLLGYLTFTQNLAWPMPSDNWFGVSWSLTVEIGFYLLFSALALVAARWKGERGFVTILALFLIVPVIARAGVPLNLSWDASVRKITVFRLDAIAYGVLLAYLMMKTRWLDQHRNALCLADALSIIGTLAWWILGIGSYSLTDRIDRTLLMNGFLVGAVLMLPGLLPLACPSPWIRRVITWVSDTSYAVYLIHLSILLWFLPLTDHWEVPIYVTVPAALTCTLVLATLSRHFIEIPLLSRRPRSG